MDVSGANWQKAQALYAVAAGRVLAAPAILTPRSGECLQPRQIIPRRSAGTVAESHRISPDPRPQSLLCPPARDASEMRADSVRRWCAAPALPARSPLAR